MWISHTSVKFVAGRGVTWCRTKPATLPSVPSYVPAPQPCTRREIGNFTRTIARTPLLLDLPLVVDNFIASQERIHQKLRHKLSASGSESQSRLQEGASGSETSNTQRKSSDNRSSHSSHSTHSNQESTRGNKFMDVLHKKGGKS